MAQFSKTLLSNSTSGRPILVTGTASPGTLIHTAVAGAASFDEIWIYAQNSTAAALNLTIEFGGTSSPNDRFFYSVPASGSGPILCIPGIPLNGALSIRAFGESANTITITGYANRIA